LGAVVVGKNLPKAHQKPVICTIFDAEIHRPKSEKAMTHNRFNRIFILSAILMISTSFGEPINTPPPDNCDPNAKAFDGYTFIYPGIVQAKSAYAPYLVQFGDYYHRYFENDIAKQENLLEWQTRFCYQAPLADIERVVYQASEYELRSISNVIQAKGKVAPAPFSNNLFADQLVTGHCTEVPEYLIFARACEQYVMPSTDKWKERKRDTVAISNLIVQGLDQFKHTESHFLRMRYAYQVVRLAHYNKNYPQVVELYNFMLPKCDRRKQSIIYYWTLGHLAGALQKMGKRPEAAYRYMLIFRNDPGKRATAHRSFNLKNDAEWKTALSFCQDDRERASMFILRAAASKIKTIEDLKAIYALDPQNEQIGLLLVSAVQSLEYVLLNNQFTELKNNQKPNVKRRDEAASKLIDLQEFAHQVIKEKKVENVKLWQCLEAYMSVLRFDDYQAEADLARCRAGLNRDDAYQRELIAQLDIWDHLLTINKLDPNNTYAEDAAFRVRSFGIHHTIPTFEPYLKERLAVAFAQNNHPGKAVVTAFDKKALLYHPNLAQLDDLIKSLSDDTGENSAIETSVGTDRMMRSDINFFIEAKGIALLGMNRPEAALVALQQLSPTYLAEASKFTPFKERISERVHTVVADSVNVTRKELVEKILQYQYAAKANFDKPDQAAKYYYLLGLCYYNCSYFGYSWNAFDAFRSGTSWTKLSKGPVFGAAGTPYGNMELLSLDAALAYFEQAYTTAQSAELRAKAAFMAARCQQKQWFCEPSCSYKPGNKEIPLVPAKYQYYQNSFLKQAKKTQFYQDVIAECKWFAAYARR
jgi:hypothetical protein